VRLLVYYEGQRPDGITEGFDLLQLKRASAFLDRHKDNLVVQGIEVKDDMPTWTGKARQRGYNFRSDAYKFCRKVFAVAHAAKTANSRRLFWINADVETMRPVPHRLFGDVLPDGYDLSRLYRERYHSECGFVGYNLDNGATRSFIEAYEKQYSTDAFLKDVAWDDCNQLDYLVKKLPVRCYNIQHRSRPQPFDNSILGHYMTHHKGARKLL